jgi:hypothetical protein
MRTHPSKVDTTQRKDQIISQQKSGKERKPLQAIEFFITIYSGSLKF